MRCLAIGLLALVTVFAAGTTGTYYSRVRATGTILANDSHPLSRLIDLQFARDPDHAEALIATWLADDGALRNAAYQALAFDDAFVYAYLWFAASALLLGTVITRRPPRLLVGLIVVSATLCGYFDHRENVAIRHALNVISGLTPGDVHAITDSAILKFIFLLIASAGLVVLGGGAARVLFKNKHADDLLEPGSFDRLVKIEAATIFEGDRPSDSPRTEPNDAADEPRVAFRSADVIGLALSGGGIRSSTFNLGLLQGLQMRNLLPLFDYLSTVSGGSYVGAFWSDWIAREGERHDEALKFEAPYPRAIFPVSRSSRSLVESDSERHLREFSRFLAPRWGFFEVETRTAIVALLAGLVPAAAIGLAVIGLGFLTWLTLLIPIAFDQSYHPRLLVVLLITSIVLFVYEQAWFNIKAQSSKRFGEIGPSRWIRFAVFTAIGLLGVGAMHSLVSAQLSVFLPQDVIYWHHAEPAAAAGLDRWWVISGVRKGVVGEAVWIISPRLFEYSATWVLSALLLIVVRFAQPLGIWNASLKVTASFDRVVMRLLGMAVLWTVVALIWHAVINIDDAATVVWRYVAAAAASGGAFAAMRNWIGVGLRKTNGEGTLTRLKPYLPQVLAYVTLILFAIAVGRVMVAVGGTNWLDWYTVAVVMTLVFCVGLFIDPEKFGLHAFYRDRLARAFTGANNCGDARENRATDAQVGDDRKLISLPGRPLHLICCAANDLAGDTVQTLGRGARSAVLSRNGIAVGNFSAKAPSLTLGSAITASAAAFNSNMGMVSKQVGPAVSFLMTMLNLRLGLWVRHPKAPLGHVRRWPGLLLYREMFGLTSASGRIGADVPLDMRDMHLSDGGHFENTALYELVRRHCRYILASDCGADPNAAFNDIGNALRRIREDFGIDISLDIEPIRADPVTGRSQQHVAVGTIHYSPIDKGILLWVKPTLTGDEPADIRQYKIESAAFPHQTTGDQFYDEAQFESYRRLGQHVAEQVFAFVPPDPSVEEGSGAQTASNSKTGRRKPPTADWMFAEAFHKWGPTPPGLAESVLAMTARFGELELELQRQGCSDIIRDVFPEPRRTPEPFQPAACGVAATPVPNHGQCEVLLFTRVAQVMEDAWLACQLETSWSHPLNLGWTNLFARWATSPSFRYWWPVICPMYSPGFVHFIDERFPVPLPSGSMSDTDPKIDVPQKGRVEQFNVGDRAEGLTETWWKKRSTQPRIFKGRALYQNLVQLPNADGTQQDIQVGMAAVTELMSADTLVAAGWTSNDFFMPPSYWGAGFGWSFLNGLLEALHTKGFDDCYVIVKAIQQDAHHRIAIEDRRSFIRQYRKIGFRQLELGDTATHVTNMAMMDRLGYESDDVLFHMRLSDWEKRRGSRSR